MSRSNKLSMDINLTGDEKTDMLTIASAVQRFGLELELHMDVTPGLIGAAYAEALARHIERIPDASAHDRLLRELFDLARVRAGELREERVRQQFDAPPATSAVH